MNRKSSLVDISKAYEQILLNEMNISNGQQPQNVLIKNFVPMNNTDEEGVVEYDIPTQLSPEQMQQNAARMDASRKQCATCGGGGCEEGCEECSDGNCEEESHEENCEDCEDSGNPNAEMAKSEVYNILTSAEKLMHLMKKSNKMEAWMLSKIIKASDYISSVSSVLEYEEYDREVNQPCADFGNDMHLITKITSMLNGEGREVNESVLRRIIFNLEILKEIK